MTINTLGTTPINTLNSLADHLIVPLFRIDPFLNYEQVIGVDFFLNSQKAWIMPAPVCALKISLENVRLISNTVRTPSKTRRRKSLGLLRSGIDHQLERAPGHGTAESDRARSVSQLGFRLGCLSR